MFNVPIITEKPTPHDRLYEYVFPTKGSVLIKARSDLIYALYRQDLFIDLFEDKATSSAASSAQAISRNLNVYSPTPIDSSLKFEYTYENLIQFIKTKYAKESLLDYHIEFELAYSIMSKNTLNDLNNMSNVLYTFGKKKEDKKLKLKYNLPDIGSKIENVKSTNKGYTIELNT